MALPYSEYSYPILIGLTLFWMHLPYSDWSYPILNAHTIFWIFWANSDWPWPYHILNTLTQFWLVLPYCEHSYPIQIGLTIFWMHLPCTSEFPGLIPDLLQEWIVLDDDGILDEWSLRRGAADRVVLVDGRSHAAALEVFFIMFLH